jgi:hypothetical protein
VAPESSRLRPDGCRCRTVRDLPPVLGGAKRLSSLRVQLCSVALTASPTVFRGPSGAYQSPIGGWHMPSRGNQGSIGHARRLDRQLARRIPVRKLRSPWDGPVDDGAAAVRLVSAAPPIDSSWLAELNALDRHPMPAHAGRPWPATPPALLQRSAAEKGEYDLDEAHDGLACDDPQRSRAVIRPS